MGATATARAFSAFRGFAGKHVLDLSGEAVGERRAGSADRIAAVQRHVTVDGLRIRPRIRLIRTGLDTGQPGLQYRQRGVGQGHPGHADRGHRVQLRPGRGLTTEPPRPGLPARSSG